MATIANKTQSQDTSMAQTSSAGAIPECKEFLLNHFQQRSDWDCGLSCILMILPRNHREHFLRDFERICAENGFGRSTWTIDLCFILRQFNISFRFLTRTIGVNPDYRGHSYYDKIISKDEERVNKKFEIAIKDGMDIEKRTISIDALIQHMALNGPVIILTNAALLYCDMCKKDPFFRSKRYSGHYVVLCGYDLNKRKIKYRNPAKENHICVASYELMDKARMAYGTDEDIILIYL
ncbi:unnamed protein product [Hermetia illucens]|uniref:Protein GUCD1 n=1 Tax=Hermetia illucens TaxID=343691 RepID=A0A7R8YXG3_HERIL|nr:protein GUCD1 [Hermetia illucens]CAD7088415.1 unnamed protein product [Hermetia illucens]